MTIKRMIIDADILLFQSAASVEHCAEWPDGMWTWHAFENEGEAALDDMVKGLYAAVVAEYPECTEVIMALSGDRSKNFRKQLLPTYKSNRKGSRKPLLYKHLEERLLKEYNCVIEETLEGDDLLGLMADDETVLVTIDKDLQTVPGHHYNFNKKEFFTVDEDSADYFNMYQALTGDTTDGYAGIPGRRFWMMSRSAGGSPWLTRRLQRRACRKTMLIASMRQPTSSVPVSTTTPRRKSKALPAHS